MEKLTECPVCKGQNLTDHLQCEDYVATHEKFNLQKCQQCTLVITNPRPTQEEIGKYYASDAYISHADKKTGIVYKLYDIVRNINLSKKLLIINQYSKKGKLLDLGCGMGNFLNAAKNNGWNAEGVDTSESAREHVKKTFGINVKDEAFLNSFEDASFDIITLWHVLEHVHLLNERVQEIKRLLKPKGTVLIAVPVYDSRDARKYGKYWDGYDVPRHLYHFNRKSMETLLNKNGLRIVDSKAMIYDSFYVSMRSEMHKKSRLPMIPGFINGLLSNLSAANSGNYSSLLFLVKHDG